MGHGVSTFNLAYHVKISGLILLDAGDLKRVELVAATKRK